VATGIAARRNSDAEPTTKREKRIMSDLGRQHITKTPGVCGGRACIAGQRIRVSDIVVWHEQRGYSPDEVVDLFPGITLADVYAALAYYFDNRQEIEEEFRKGQEWAEWVNANEPSKIPAKLNGGDGG
jgi:uncharacterized protein (DUF433 family)